MVRRLTDYLDKNSVKYVVLTHSPAYTALEVAVTTHVPGREVAKAVMVNAEGKMCMAVLPSSYMIDFGALQKALGKADAELAAEADFRESFPECEVGAMPPFGNLFGIEVYVDQHLIEQPEIIFNAGTHRELIKMATDDFQRLVQPKVFSFGVKRKKLEDEVDIMP